MTYPFRNLAFAGAGVRNPGYVGAVEAVDEAGALGSIEGVAGTSSGSIIATLLAVGYTSSELRQAMLDLDFGKITDGGVLRGAYNLLTGFGWHPGDYFRRKMEETIAAKTGNGRMTFRDLERGSYRSLRIVGTNLSTHRARIFPDADSLDMPLAEAVRVSMSIPVFFRSVRMQGNVYVDGGVILNYPLGVFDTPGGDSRRTLGVHMKAPVSQPHCQRVRTFPDFAGALFASLVATQEEDVRLSPVDRARSIGVEDLGIHPADFRIGNDQKLALMKQGLETTRRHLSNLSSVDRPQLTDRERASAQ